MHKKGIIQKLFFYPDDWSGSFGQNIIQIIDRNITLPPRVKEVLTIHQQDEMSTNAYVITGEFVSRKIMNDFRSLATTDDFFASIEGAVVSVRNELRGVFVSTGFYDFFDPLCPFPFPDGFQEKIYEYAEQCAIDALAEVIDDYFDFPIRKALRET